MTTKAHGNIVQVTGNGDGAGAGRLLSDGMCYRTTSMSASEQDRIWDEFLHGDSLVYDLTTVDNELSVETGPVRYVSGFMTGVPISLVIDYAHELFPGHFDEVRSDLPSTSAGEAWLDRAISIQEGNEVNEVDCE